MRWEPRIGRSLVLSKEGRRCAARARSRREMPEKEEVVEQIRSTTILAVRRQGKVAIGGDGQVTLGQVVMKSDARKIRRLHGGKVLVGFAGASADAFALMERFEAKLKDHQGSVPRAATELAKEWRTDRALRRLEAMMIAVDRDSLLLVSGTGDVIQPSDGAAAIGSGGSYALAAARAACWLTPNWEPSRSSAPPWRSPATCASIATRISRSRKCNCLAAPSIYRFAKR